MAGLRAATLDPCWRDDRFPDSPPNPVSRSPNPVLTSSNPVVLSSDPVLTSPDPVRPRLFYSLTLLLVYHPGLRTHPANHPVRLAVRVSATVNQAKHPVGMPAIVPEPHGGAILGGEVGGRQAVRVQRDVGMNRP